MCLSYGTTYGWDIVEIRSYPNDSQSSTFGGNNEKFTVKEKPSWCYRGKNAVWCSSVQLDIKQIREDGTVDGTLLLNL